MRIGITERGDASADYNWEKKLCSVDAAVLVTKNLTDTFIQKVQAYHESGAKLIVHATCTGYGGTALEPGVCNYKKQIAQLKKLCECFPCSQCVFRVDPIFPSEKGLAVFDKVMREFIDANTGINRIRISVVDEYAHVKSRYRKHKWIPLYEGTRKFANASELSAVTQTLTKYPYVFEACAEDRLAEMCKNVCAQGCISFKEFDILNLAVPGNLVENMQQRTGCHCLSVKTELLTQKYQCNNKCAYCYWHDKKE